jgi:hypothetical protein
MIIIRIHAHFSLSLSLSRSHAGFFSNMLRCTDSGQRPGTLLEQLSASAVISYAGRISVLQRRWLRLSLHINTVIHSRSYTPYSFAPALLTFPQVEPDPTTSCACSLQQPEAGQLCASPTHCLWKMKRRGPPRSITIMQIIKVMP